MTKAITLRSTLNRVMIVTLAVVAILATGALFGYSQIKQNLAEKSLVESLISQSHAQIESLIPSLLVPEQKSGAEVFLDRFRETEHLDKLFIAPTESDLAKTLGTCSQLENARVCRSQDQTQIITIIPIQESNQNFGFLVKIKRMPNPLMGDHLLQVIEAATGVLLLSFLVLFIFLTRITAHEVPNELGNLASWIENSLAGKSTTEFPTLKFKELNDLGIQIADIINQHDQDRDQAMIGQLTSGIMHDIKTPLHSIVTAQGLVAELPVDSIKRPKRLENLTRITGINLPIIEGIIESTLDGVRQIHLNKTLTDLKDTIQSSVEIHSPSIRQRKIQIEMELGAHPILFHHDPIQLGRVFSNLIKNSIEAFDLPKTTEVDRPPKIRISIEKSLGTDSECGYAKLIFEDSGPGLPENPEKVFRAFRSAKPRGSGLGLIVSRRIVEAHGGQLTASRSAQLSGACFEVELQNSANDGFQIMEGKT